MKATAGYFPTIPDLFVYKHTKYGSLQSAHMLFVLTG